MPPDRCPAQHREPSRSELVIAGERFAFHDEAGSDAVDLSSNPLARQFVENFIVLFSGDLAKLRERYEPEFTSRERTGASRCDRGAARSPIWSSASPWWERGHGCAAW